MARLSLLLPPWETCSPRIDEPERHVTGVSPGLDTPERAEVHRFTNEWEKTVSLALRHVHIRVIDTCLDHDCLREGDEDALTDAAFIAWRTGRSHHGLASVVISETRDYVTALNQCAFADLIRDCILTPGREVELTDGTRAEVGDMVTTRRDDRRLRDGEDWVRNGNTWTSTGVRNRRLSHRPSDWKPVRRCHRVSCRLRSRLC